MDNNAVKLLNVESIKQAYLLGCAEPYKKNLCFIAPRAAYMVLYYRTNARYFLKGNLRYTVCCTLTWLGFNNVTLKVNCRSKYSGLNYSLYTFTCINV